MTETKRIRYLDLARGIGILFVVIGHIEYVNENVRYFVTAFHMPLFLVISGILILEKKEETKSWKQLLGRKLRRIMLPYAIFSLLSFVIEGSRIAIKGLDEWDVILWQLMQSLCLQGVSTLWFLPALFISELTFVGIRKKTSKLGTISIVTILVVLCAWAGDLERTYYELHAQEWVYRILHEVVSMLLRNLFCVGFIAMGYFLNDVLLQKLNELGRELLILLIVLPITLFMIKINPGVDLRFMLWNNFPLYITEVLGGTMSVLLLCRILEKTPIRIPVKILEFWGCNSLIIMVTHMDFRVLRCSIEMAGRLRMVLPMDGLFNLFIVVFVFVLEIPIIWFINHYMPFLIGKSTKVHKGLMK